MTTASEVLAVLEAHDAKVGPITGTWACACGATSTNINIRDDDLTGIEERRGEYRTHLTDQIVAEVTR